MAFTKKEIEKYIKREERYIDKCKSDIVSSKCGIKTSRKAIKMWKSELAKLAKEEKAKKTA